MIRLQSHMVLVQIGTFDGEDEFNILAKKCDPSKVVLVEPNRMMVPQICKNYEGVKHVFIESVAITEVNKGMVQLVHPAKVSRKSGEFYNKCFSLLPMDDWGSNLKSIPVPSMSFTELCEKHSLTHIHCLQIDTEGYDSEIIRSIDFTKVTIDILIYENWSFPTDCFSRHGERAERYGIKGMLAVEQLLKGLGYTLSRYGSENIIATK